MTLTTCHECKAEISTAAKACPKCGYRVPGGPKIGRAILALAVLGGIIFAGSAFFVGKTSSANAMRAALDRIGNPTSGQAYITRYTEHRDGKEHYTCGMVVDASKPEGDPEHSRLFVVIQKGWAHINSATYIDGDDNFWFMYNNLAGCYDGS